MTDPGPAGRRRILAAIDFSPASVSVVAAAVALARRTRGAIEVLFVYPCGPPARAARRRSAEGVSAEVTEDVEGLLEPARAAGIPVRVCLRVGDPAREIEEEIRRTRPDVAVLGTHGARGFRRRALRSVAAEVMHAAVCPVVTIAQRKMPPAAGSPRDEVVCAVALAESSPRTIAYAAELAAGLHAQLTLVHVLGPGARRRRDAEARLHAAAAAAAHGLPPAHVHEMVVSGRPARRILQIAARRDPAFVVVGAPRAKDAPESTSDVVVRGARWPVVTV